MLKFTNLGRTLTDFFLRGESAQTAQGLSGRMDVWQLSIDAFLRRPWTGYGGFAGSRFVIIPGTAWEASGGSSASNTYLDSLLGLGVAGPLLIVVVVAAAAWFLFQAIRNSQVTSSDRPLTIEMLVVLSVIAVRSLISSNITGHPPLGFLAVIGFVEVARRQRVGARRRRILMGTS
jgi:O-antigen ligase